MKSIIKSIALVSILAVFGSALVISCKKDNVLTYDAAKKQKLSYYADSVRVHDSLTQINQGGLIDYSIQVVSGSTSSITLSIGGRSAAGAGTDKTLSAQKVVAGAVITINQYGKRVKDSTGSAGIVVFKNLLRGGIGVTIQKSGFTEVSYVAGIEPDNGNTINTYNGTRHTMGNIIPLFETTGTNTATITGQGTAQLDLTNTTRELIPDASAVSVVANIDATDPTFNTQFINGNNTLTAIKADFVPSVLQVSYATGTSAKITGGVYSLTVPAAVDGLPIKISYSDFANSQKVFETGSGSGGSFNQIVNYRQLFGAGIATSAVPSAAGVNITFAGGGGAAATAVMNVQQILDRITVTNGGSNYSGTPIVTFSGGGGGTGAAATATVTNGVLTGVTLTSAGSGYTADPTVNFISGTGATANSTLDNTKQAVFAVSVTGGGTGYTSAPAVTFTGGGGSGAAATAIISNGSVVSVTVTSQGSAYTGAPAISFTGGGGAGATASPILGAPILQVNVTGGGSNYTYPPKVSFSNPQLIGGTLPTATAVVDASTLTVTGIVINTPGSGYTVAPTVTLNAGSGATAVATRVGGTVLGASITNGGTQYYTGVPNVRFVTLAGQGGQGATGTAVVANGKVVSITITNPGAGYTSAPTIAFDDPSGAQAFANIVNGTIGSITVVNGGFNYTGAPVVSIVPTIGAPGGSALATATVAGGQVTGVTVTSAGTGYIGGNVPSLAESFTTTNGNTLVGTKSFTKVFTTTGKTVVNDVYYGTGQKVSN